MKFKQCLSLTVLATKAARTSSISTLHLEQPRTILSIISRISSILFIFDSANRGSSSCSLSGIKDASVSDDYELALRVDERLHKSNSFQANETVDCVVEAYIYPILPEDFIM